MTPVGRRRGVPTAVASVVTVAALVAAALLATGTASPAVAFQQTGRWVFNRSEGVVAHVDGGTRQVDARVSAPAVGEAVMTVQSATQGFVVGRKSITVFGKSSLTVEGTVPAAGPEVPVGIEVIGGPYLVYRESGVIVRLGEPPVTVRVGGPVDRPTYTDDGTVWVHRPDTGAVCALRLGSDALDCARSTAPGLPGALVVATQSVAYLDTADDAAQLVDGSGPASAAPIGADLAQGSLVGDRDTRNRLPVVVPGVNRLVLADSAGVPSGAPGGAPLTVDLGPGEFSSPVASDGVVAVVEQVRHRLLIFAVDGRQLGSADLPADGQDVPARGGDGRIYVDDANGAVTRVVGADGSITPVSTGGSVTAVTAPAPDLLRPVLPPRPADPPPAPVVGGPGPTVPLPIPALPVTTGPTAPPPPPPVPAPVPPTGVTARAAADGTVAVSWQAGNGATGVTYTVRPVPGGAVQTAAGTTATFTGLTPGTSYTFGVTAANSAGTSAESALSNAVTVLAGPPGAPVGLRVTLDGVEGATGLTKWIAVAWSAPPLNGGELVKYVVREYDRDGKTDPSLYMETTGTTAQNPNGYTCLAPFRIDVAAVTRTPGTQTQVTGPVASVSTTTTLDCTIAISITAQAASATSVTVTMTKTSGVDYAYWPCDLLFGGVVKWSGNCGGVQKGNSTTATVTGLAPATTYSVVLRIKQRTTTTSNTVTVTTPP